MAAARREGIKGSPHSQTCRRFPDAGLERRARDAYQNLGKWLDRDGMKEPFPQARSPWNSTPNYAATPGRPSLLARGEAQFTYIL